MTCLFQYGSNCSGERLNAENRLRGTATNPRLAETIGEFDIAFNVWSNSNGCAASNLIPSVGHHAWGVFYDIPDDRLHGKGTPGRKTMADIEGPRYEPTTITVRTTSGETVQATTFFVKKSAEKDGLWTNRGYVAHIVEGLRANNAPRAYIDHVIDTAIATNERAQHQARKEAQVIATLREAL